jgi:hypothetical protein
MLAKIPAAAVLSFLLLAGARAFAAETDSRDSIRDAGELAFVREGKSWVRTDALCLSQPARALAYVVKLGGSATLKIQNSRDGKVSRAQEIGARSKVEGDCAAGSCFDIFSRPLPGQGSGAALDYKGRMSNVEGDWDFAYQVTSTKSGIPALDCAGGRLLISCVTPRWEVRVSQEQQNAEHPRVLYTASHLVGKKEQLSLEHGVVAASGNSVSFDHEGYLYTVTASADSKAPSASLRVTHDGKTILKEACTAYSVDAAKLAQARAGQPQP